MASELHHRNLVLTTVVATSHEWGDVRLCDLEAHQLPTLVELHKELLPVEYEASWYQSLLLPGSQCVCAWAVSPDGVVGAPGSSRLVGFATARDSGGETDPSPWLALFAGVCTRLGLSFSAPGAPREGYIMTLGVAQAWRRRGLAKRLLAWVNARLVRPEAGRGHACTAVSLHVLQTNTGAQALYAEAGFQSVSVHTAHYFLWGAWQPAVFMTRALSASDAAGAPPVSTAALQPFGTRPPPSLRHAVIWFAGLVRRALSACRSLLASPHRFERGVDGDIV